MKSRGVAGYWGLARRFFLPGLACVFMLAAFYALHFIPVGDGFGEIMFAVLAQIGAQAGIALFALVQVLRLAYRRSYRLAGLWAAPLALGAALHLVPGLDQIGRHRLLVVQHSARMATCGSGDDLEICEAGGGMGVTNVIVYDPTDEAGLPPDQKSPSRRDLYEGLCGHALTYLRGHYYLCSF